MATNTLLFALADREDPASNAPALVVTTSGAAATTNAFQVEIPHLDFDATTDEDTSFPFRVPSDYTSGGTVVLQWLCIGDQSGAVIWKASIYVATANSSDIDTSAAFNAVDTSGAVTLPATAGHFTQTSIALTSPGLAADRYAILMVGRDASAAGDTASTDAQLLSVSFTYTST